jgi:hypothetical protein
MDPNNSPFEGALKAWRHTVGKSDKLLYVKDLRVVKRLLLGLAVLVACDADPSGGNSGEPTVALSAVSGDAQRVAVGARAALPLTVRVVDATSRTAVADVAVEFRVVRGAAQLSDLVVPSGADGVARTEVRAAGVVGDSVVVTAAVTGQPLVRFTLYVDAAPAVTGLSAVAVRSGDTIEVRGRALQSATSPASVFIDAFAAPVVRASDTSLLVVVPPCLSGDEVWLRVERAGARSAPRPLQYVAGVPTITLAPASMLSVDAAASDDCLVLAGDGAEYLVIAQYAAGTETPTDIPVSLSVSGDAVGLALRSTSAARASAAGAFESVLRQRERGLAASGLPRGAALRAPVAPPPIGAARRYPVIATLAADRFDTVSTRLQYAGDNVLIWVDTAVTIADASLRPLGEWFDRELYGLDVAHFGLPSDIDGDARVHVVLTPVVNALTPRSQCSLSGYVAGFVSAHDLFPRQANAAGAEVFYGFVPDSVGRFGCAHTATTWGRTIPLTFVHELQHLINFNQKVFVRGGREESVWLNEGLSHYAEELASLVQERRYPWPAGRASPEQQFPDTAGWFILNNMINSYLFLREPYKHSLTAIGGGGTLEERGAGWLFVRWLADRFGEDMPRRLVQSPLRGASNVQDRTGVQFAQLAAEFAVMGYADSLPGVPRGTVAPSLRLTSRNLRSLFARLGVIIAVPEFPIEPAVLRPGETVRGDLRSAGHLYARVSTEGVAAVSLRFRRDDGTSWSAADAPRLTIFRLP